MIKYYSLSQDDFLHLYKYDDETNDFWQMDHCWTGEGKWIKIGHGTNIPKRYVEISEEKAKRWEVGNDPNNKYPRKNIQL